MRILSAVLFLAFASEALAECGNLCDSSWWGTATNADVQAELNAGADVMAKGDIMAKRLYIMLLNMGRQRLLKP